MRTSWDIVQQVLYIIIDTTIFRRYTVGPDIFYTLYILIFIKQLIKAFKAWTVLAVRSINFNMNLKYRF